MDWYRQRILEQLASSEDGTKTVGELGTALAGSKLDADRDGDVETEPTALVGHSTAAAVATTLTEDVLPALKADGVVAFDDEAGSVSLPVEAEDEEEMHWSAFYLGVGLAALSFVGLSTIEGFPFSSLPSEVWAIVIAVFLTVVSLAQYLDSRLDWLQSARSPPRFGMSG